MSLKKLSVSNGRLYDLTRPGESIPLDTPDWVAWLENPATTGFSYPILNPARGYVEGWMTVRKERRARGGAYWSVYRRSHGALRRIYLGRAPSVTHARLQAIAEALLKESVSSEATGLAAPLASS